MNAQHKINKQQNRQRRVYRRISELNSKIVYKEKEAKDKFVPDLSKELSQINRLKAIQQ